MAGTAYPLDKTYFMRGPGKIFANVALPSAPTGVITLASDGTPDASANPSAVAIGATEAGAKFMAKPLYETDSIDEVNGIFDRAIIGWEMSIEGIYRQTRDYALNDQIIPGATLATTAAGSGTKGRKKLNFGLGAVDLYPVVLISKIPNSSPALFDVFMLYAAINEAGIELEITRAKSARSPFKFTANQIPGRDETDAFGAMWSELAAL